MEYFGNKKLKDITTATISHFFATHKTEIKGEMRTLSPANAKRIYCNGAYFDKKTPNKHQMLGMG